MPLQGSELRLGGAATARRPVARWSSACVRRAWSRCGPGSSRASRSWSGARSGWRKARRSSPRWSSGPARRSRGGRHRGRRQGYRKLGDQVRNRNRPAPIYPRGRRRPAGLARRLRGAANVVLYFYPADDTPGCTKEACGFRDAWDDLAGLGVTVLGVSPDAAESHRAFAAKYRLPFTLLSDPDRIGHAGLRRLWREDDVRPEGDRRDPLDRVDRPRRPGATALAPGGQCGAASGQGSGGDSRRRDPAMGLYCTPPV